MTVVKVWGPKGCSPHAVVSDPTHFLPVSCPLFSCPIQNKGKKCSKLNLIFKWKSSEYDVSLTNVYIKQNFSEPAMNIADDIGYVEKMTNHQNHVFRENSADK